MQIFSELDIVCDKVLHSGRACGSRMVDEETAGACRVAIKEIGVSIIVAVQLALKCTRTRSFLFARSCVCSFADCNAFEKK